MSDEERMEAAYRHADHGFYHPWHPPQPDEALMGAEDGTAEAELRADTHEALFCYVFGGGAECWQHVGRRVVAVMRALAPGLLGRRRRECGEIWRKCDERLAEAAGGAFRMGSFQGLLGNGQAKVVERILEWVFVPGGRDWLKEGVRRMYLIAAAYQPDLVRIGGREAGYEGFARVFGELDGTCADEGARARSRWSARAQNVLRRPIEAGGGKVPALFGKSATVRAKYRAAGKGNQNRRMEGKHNANE